MSRDTMAIIGTIVGIGLVLGGLLSAQFRVVNTRIDDLAASVNTRIDDVNSRIDDLRSEVAELRADMRGLDTRLRAVEITLGKVGQRLDTLERLHLPSADPGE